MTPEQQKNSDELQIVVAEELVKKIRGEAGSKLFNSNT